MIYRILLNRTPDVSAPSRVFLSDYEEIGTVEADSRVKAYSQISDIVGMGMREYKARKFQPTVDLDSYAHLRAMIPGDILVDESNVAYILTPQYQWSITGLVIN